MFNVHTIHTSIAAGGSNVARFSLLLIPVFPGGDGGEAGGGRLLVLPLNTGLVSGCKGRQTSLHQLCPVWAAGLLQDKAEPSETLLSPAAACSQHGHHQQLSQYLVYSWIH